MTPASGLSEAALLDRARDVISGILKMPHGEIEAHVPLAVYGLDSVSALEIVAALEPLAGRPLPDWLVAECPTLEALVQALERTEDPPALTSTDDAGRALIADDLQLPDDIRPSRGAPLRPARHILLTGATGFLGAFVLAELVQTTQATVHCLIRTGPGVQGSRIQLNLERYGLWDPALRERITVVVGDVTMPRFGLDAAAYRALAGVVDAVYHAAGDISWVQPYAALRETNVAGTVEVLRFAATARAKSVEFVSSLSVCYATGGPSSVDERTDMLPFVHDLALGYAKSKLVAESLVREAMARGQTARIYRPSVIVGDSATGAANLDDIVSLLLKGCIEMAAAPDLDWVIDGPPVDHVARAIVRLAGGASAASSDVCHLAADRPRHWRECVLWTRLFGYPIRLVPFTEWQAQLRRDAADASHPLHALRPFFLRPVSDGLTAAELFEDHRRSATERLATRQAEIEANLECPRLDARAMDRYFQNYIARGFLTPGSRGPGVQGSRGPSHFHAKCEAMLRHAFADPSLRLRALDLVQSGSDHSIVSELTSWRHGAHHGLFHYRASLESATAPPRLDVMAKCKPTDTDVIAVAEAVGDVCGAALGDAIRHHQSALGLGASHLRELAVYGEAPELVRRLMPACYGTWRDEGAREYGVLLERLDDVELMNSADKPERWSTRDVEVAVTGLAELHTAWRGRVASIRHAEWIGDVATPQSMTEAQPLWRALADHAAPYLAEWAGGHVVRVHCELVESVAGWWPALDAVPATLIHHDFNPRNIGLRTRDGRRQLCAYDWELATIGAPQRDLAELLCFVLNDTTTAVTLDRHLEDHRARLSTGLGTAIDRTAACAGFQSALADLLVRRLAFYTMIHRVRPQRYLARVVRTWAHLFDLSVRSLTA